MSGWEIKHYEEIQNERGEIRGNSLKGIKGHASICRWEIRINWHSSCVSQSYQFGQAPLWEDPSGTREVEVSGDPAAHVEPIHSSFGWGAIFSVQQHQLFLGTHGTSFQHTLQLEGSHQTQMCLNILYTLSFYRVAPVDACADFWALAQKNTANLWQVERTQGLSEHRFSMCTGVWLQFLGCVWE